MTHKAIRYSAHAAARLADRAISRADVRRAIAKGVITSDGAADSVKVAALRTTKGALEVHYREGAAGIYIITVLYRER